MTLPELAAAITPIAEQFAHELALEDATFVNHETCATCLGAHGAAAILGALVHAIDQANEGRPQLLEALARRAGYLPAVQELVRSC